MKRLIAAFLCAALLISPEVLSASFGSSVSNNGCGSSDGCDSRISSTRSCGSESSDNCVSCHGSGYFNPRSVGADTARELVGWQWVIHGGQGKIGESFGAATLAYQYNRSYRGYRIAQAMFGSDQIALQGSNITGANRDPRALIADMFGLSNTYDGTITLKPRIQSHVVDLNLFYALGGCGCWDNLYFRLHAPVGISKWTMSLCSTETTGSSTYYSECMSNSLGQYGASITGVQALQGQAASFYDSSTKLLKSGYFDTCNNWKARLADIDLIMGYNFIWEEAKHAGIYAQVVVPTGNRPNGRSVFQTVIGNRQHVEFGGGFSAHQVMWDNQCDSSFSWHFEGNITHMMKNRENRLLDFNCSPFSRYLLLREFNTDGTPTGRLVSATDFNYRNVDIKLALKGDASFKLSYRNCGWGADLGYNIYGHSGESISWKNGCSDCDKQPSYLGKAGITDVCGTQYCGTTTTGGIYSNGCIIENTVATTTPGVLINPTFNSAANAFTPVQNFDADNYTPVTNVSSNSGCFALLPGSPNYVTGSSIATTNNSGCAGNAQGISYQNLAPHSTSPVYVQQSDLNPQSAGASAALTHKIFGFVNYQWADECEWNPHVGLGGSVEFDGRSSNCRRPGLNQWSLLLKGGFSY